MVLPKVCVECKAHKFLCGLKVCPLIEKAKSIKRTLSRFPSSGTISGSSGDVFVYSSKSGFSFGPTSSDFVSVKELFGMDYNSVVRKMSSTVFFKKFGSRTEDAISEIAMTVKPIDVEVVATRPPSPRLSLSALHSPIGFVAPAKKVFLQENPKIPKKVYSIVDEDIAATDSLFELYSHGFDSYYLTKLFSSGLLGRKGSKTLVPTRNSITAVDDILSKKLIRRINYYKPISKVFVGKSEFAHNRFFVIVFPSSCWRFENVEVWSSGSLWNPGKKPISTFESEMLKPRTTYCSSQSGAYYASRLSVAEHLDRIMRCASVVVVREIGYKYVFPIGVWEVRENVRNAISSLKTVSSLDEAIYLLKCWSSFGGSYIIKSRVLFQTTL